MNTIAKDNFPHIFDYLNQIDLLRLVSVNKLLNEMVMKYIENTKFYRINKDYKFRKACINNYIISIIKIQRECGLNFGLNLACKYGHIELVKILIDYGADKFGYAFNISCIYGHINIAKLLIGNISNKWKKYGCNNALKNGYYDIVILLVNNGIKKLDLCNASYGGNLEIVKLCIEKGCNNYKDAFLWACSFNRFNIIDYFLEKKYITIKNIHIWNKVMSIAIRNNNYKLLKISISYGATNINE